MAGVIGNIGPFDDSVEQWACYFDYFITANGIADDKIVPTFLNVMGPKTFNVLCNLLQPTKRGAKTFKEIVDTLTHNFLPKPLVIAEIQVSQTQPGGRRISHYVCSSIRQIG